VVIANAKIANAVNVMINNAEMLNVAKKEIVVNQSPKANAVMKKNSAASSN
jgi:hypothetical protein